MTATTEARPRPHRPATGHPGGLSGCRAVLDPDVLVVPEPHGPAAYPSTLLVSTTAAVAVRLRPAATRALGGGRTVEIADRTSHTLAAALLTRGLAHPVWDPSLAPLHDVTVVVPVKDRPDHLARLLDALGAAPDLATVLVVDDGSDGPDQIHDVVRAAGARVRLVRHQVCRGPAAARNTGLRQSSTPFVAFVDSDVVPTPDALARLRRHLDDESVGLVAPRVSALEEAAGWIATYERYRSPLDMGPRPGPVRPGARISYVCSATVLARREALGTGFDESMPVAEDVDAVWRMVDAGWTVRYCPDAVVHHDHRVSPRAWWARRTFYGTGAAPLWHRHGDRIAPVRLTPLTALAVVGLLLRGRVGAAAIGAAVLTHLGLQVTRRDGLAHRRPALALRITARTLAGCAEQVAGSVNRHHWPVHLAAALIWPRARHTVLVCALAEGALDYRRTGPQQSFLPYLAARRLDDLAYGWGLWRGAVRGRAWGALRPHLVHHARA
ncbi:MAG: mycofactocin biosynthesis glycosyltransferase MftF [Dermatophilaceae bacterium]